MMFRGFQWYRNKVGGKWWFVFGLDDQCNIWINESDKPSFPEYDGLYMDTTGFIKHDRAFCGWENMYNLPTEDYTSG